MGNNNTVGACRPLTFLILGAALVFGCIGFWAVVYAAGLGGMVKP